MIIRLYELCSNDVPLYSIMSLNAAWCAHRILSFFPDEFSQSVSTICQSLNFMNNFLECVCISNIFCYYAMHLQPVLTGIGTKFATTVNWEVRPSRRHLDVIWQSS